MTLLLTLLLLACSSPLEDRDHDHLTDAQEAELGTPADNPDADGDGLLDGVEHHCTRTHPLQPDSDHDGDDDGWELDRGLSPTNPDEAGYPDDSPRLTLAQRASLHPERAPDVLRPGLPLRDVTLRDATLGPVALYDLALQGRPLLLALLPPADEPALRAWLEGGPPPHPELADLPDHVQLIWVRYETADGSPAQPEPSPPGVRLLTDRAFALWGHAGRPQTARWILVDDHMLVLATDADGWDHLQRLIPAPR